LGTCPEPDDKSVDSSITINTHNPNMIRPCLVTIMTHTTIINHYAGAYYEHMKITAQQVAASKLPTRRTHLDTP